MLDPRIGDYSIKHMVNDTWVDRGALHVYFIKIRVKIRDISVLERD